MNHIIEIIKYSLSSGFWHFVGCYVMCLLPVSVVILMNKSIYNICITIIKKMIK